MKNILCTVETIYSIFNVYTFDVLRNVALSYKQKYELSFSSGMCMSKFSGNCNCSSVAYLHLFLAYLNIGKLQLVWFVGSRSKKFKIYFSLFS